MGSSSVGWLEQVCSLNISVHFRPLVRYVDYGSLHDLVHLQVSNCNTASGAGEPLIHSIASFPSSSVVHPLSLGSGTEGWVFRDRLNIAAWLLAHMACMKRQSSHGGSWLDSASPRLAQKSWWRRVFTSVVRVECTYIWHVIYCSFSKSSSDTSQERPSSLKASW